MGKTKIIIEMPTMLYLTLKLDGIWGYPRLTEIIRNGTPLPKGHGDLIDRQALINDGIEKGFCDWYDEIKYADTIIEADKGE